MIGDFMTKPVQGALFRKFRDQIMGVVPAQDPGPGKVDPPNDEWKIVEPRKGKKKKVASLVQSKGTGRHHRSVLGESSKESSQRQKDGRRINGKTK